MGKSKKRQRSAEDEATTEADTAPAATLPTKKAKLENGEAIERKSESIAPETTEKKKKKKEKKDKREKKIKDEDDNQEEEEEVVKESKEERKARKEAKKAKKEAEKKQRAAEDELVAEAVETPVTAVPTKKEKKEKRAKKTDDAKKPEESRENQEDGAKKAESGSAQESKDGKREKFICFIGNIPFTSTVDDVKAHFSSLQPISVRLLSKKDKPGKSRGVAFIEFDRFDRMKTCLEKFHHSDFNDGKSEVRKINVELTAGGGGNTPYRKDKIKEKNEKLNEERRQRMAKEEAAKLEKAKTNKEPEPAQEATDEDQIHPSRRGRVPNHRGDH